VQGCRYRDATEHRRGAVERQGLLLHLEQRGPMEETGEEPITMAVAVGGCEHVVPEGCPAMPL